MYVDAAIYHKTMNCVHQNMDNFDTMRLGLRRRITRDGMLPIIRRIMEVDPRQRITAAEEANALKSYYLNLQADLQLRCEIDHRDNPGDPLRLRRRRPRQRDDLGPV